MPTKKKYSLYLDEDNVNLLREYFTAGGYPRGMLSAWIDDKIESQLVLLESTENQLSLDFLEAKLKDKKLGK